MSSPALLAVDDLRVSFPGDRRRGPRLEVVRGVSLRIRRGEMVGLVGESGSGKTLTALALLRLVPPPGRVGGGRALLAADPASGAPAVDLLALPEARLPAVRGRRVAMVFQEPSTALNPLFSIGFQVAEAVRAHRRPDGSRPGRRAARREAVRLLEWVALPDAARRLGDYPHQLSGGQLQRVMIAMALAAGPDLLVADEPTTALDVTVQAQILALLERLRRELGLAVLLITHDLGVVAQTCERVLVMYCGEIVERAATGDLFHRPAHPYTRALLAATPRLGRRVPRGELPTVPGRVPDPAHRPAGCPFHPRCPEVMEVCRQREPELYPVADGAAGRRARCFLHEVEGAPGEPPPGAAGRDGGCRNGERRGGGRRGAGEGAAP